MFSVADLLDRAKAKAGIDSDYRLAKVIGITHSVVSSYRMKKSMPDDKILSQLCALSGDDVGVVAAEVHALRSKTPEAKSMWMAIAARLQHGAASVGGVVALVMAVGLFATLFVADDAYAEAPTALQQFLSAGQSVHYV